MGSIYCSVLSYRTKQNKTKLWFSRIKQLSEITLLARFESEFQLKQCYSEPKALLFFLIFLVLFHLFFLLLFCGTQDVMLARQTL